METAVPTNVVQWILMNISWPPRLVQSCAHGKCGWEVPIVAAAQDRPPEHLKMQRVIVSRYKEVTFWTLALMWREQV